MQTAIATRLAVALTGSLVSTASVLAADPPGTPMLEKVTVGAVARFDFDKATIHADDQAKILTEVGQMKDVTWQTVTATGHTDSVGPAAYNQKLSDRRAQAVKAYLVGKGLDPAMINTAAKAATAPVTSNDTAAGRAQNRRTEIEFKGVRSVVR
jgi:OOP family OmpA-OmpF porin